MTRPSDRGFGMDRRPRSASTMTKEGAGHLARNIERYWSGQGYPPKMVGVRIVRDDDEEAYWVRSNLRNGSPPGKPVEAVKGGQR